VNVRRVVKLDAMPRPMIARLHSGAANAFRFRLTDTTSHHRIYSPFYRAHLLLLSPTGETSSPIRDSDCGDGHDRSPVLRTAL
jgi:hypothetical protein